MFGAYVSRSFLSFNIAESASSVVALSVVASYVLAAWVVALCCIPSVAASVLVVVAYVDYIYCLLYVVSGVVVPLVVQHPLALSYGFLWGSRPSFFVLLR